jgi:hypothetical protein
VENIFIVTGTRIRSHSGMNAVMILSINLNKILGDSLKLSYPLLYYIL